jgi:aryl-alcohol dehydrogenase-like predicted oxidoreductase
MQPQLPFGRTGHSSSRLIFGAVALGRVTQAEANETLDSLLEYGVNHIDTAHLLNHPLNAPRAKPPLQSPAHTPAARPN